MSDSSESDVKSQVTTVTPVTFSSLSSVFPEDPALWPDTITEQIREYFVFNKPQQQYGNVLTSGVFYAKKMRTFQLSHFYRKLSNGERIKREWLVYSTGRVYCDVCKLFCNIATALSAAGFNDWKNIRCCLSEHEISHDHINAMFALVSRAKLRGRVDLDVIKQCENERNYWRDVLRRIVATVKFLASRGSAFHGKTSKPFHASNGNYLGCLEYLSEFDQCLSKHLAKYGSSGKDNTSYLSNVIC